MAFFVAFINAGCAAADAWAYGEYGDTTSLVMLVVNSAFAMALFTAAVAGW